MMEMEKLCHEDDKEDEVDGDGDGDGEGALLPGFRFHPTDQELVEFYLTRKVEKRPAKIDIIRIVDVYKYEPWDLPKVVGKVGEREWYFFCRRGRKYKNSIRPNRVTGSGFWKATGIDKPIHSLQQIHNCIGLKKSLVYYRGTAGKGTKTDWMMHEFRLPVSAMASSTQEAEVWTLCRIFKRESSYKNYIPDRKDSFPPRQSHSHYSNGSYSCLSFDQSTVRNPISDNFNMGTHIPFMTSYLSFTSPNTNENSVESSSTNWDELRPMVQVALDQSAVYSLR